MYFLLSSHRNFLSPVLFVFTFFFAITISSISFTSPLLSLSCLTLRASCYLPSGYSLIPVTPFPVSLPANYRILYLLPLVPYSPTVIINPPLVLSFSFPFSTFNTQTLHTILPTHTMLKIPPPSTLHTPSVRAFNASCYSWKTNIFIPPLSFVSLTHTPTPSPLLRLPGRKK